MPTSTTITVNTTNFDPSSPIVVKTGDKIGFILGAGRTTPTSVTIVFDSHNKSPFSRPDNPIDVTGTTDTQWYTVNGTAANGDYTLEAPTQSPKRTTMTGTIRVNN